MNEISKQVIKPIKTTDDFQSSKTQNSAKEDAIENTKKSIGLLFLNTNQQKNQNLIFNKHIIYNPYIIQKLLQDKLRKI